jgi:hypothetical protein
VSSCLQTPPTNKDTHRQFLRCRSRLVMCVRLDCAGGTTPPPKAGV